MVQIDELFRYDDRRVVVTGCASGIGAALSRQLAKLGAEVVGLDPAGQRHVRRPLAGHDVRRHARALGHEFVHDPLQRE